MNAIHTDAEYMAQGFKPEELADIRRHDLLINKWYEQNGWLSGEEGAEVIEIARRLKL